MRSVALTTFAADSWRNRDPSERRQLVNSAFVERTRLDSIIVTMNRMRRDFREKAETKCMVVVGEPGVGKSTLFEHYRDSSRVDEIVSDTGIRRPKPVIYVQLPSDATVNVCSDAILSAVMGRDLRTNGRSKEGQLESQLRINEVELIILDDFQHAASKGREKTKSQTADFVKSITKRSRIPVVMAGLPELAELIDHNRQLQTITPYRNAIPRYQFHTDGQKKAFRNFLQGLDGLLPFDTESGFKADERSAAIFLATAGLLRPLKNLIGCAAGMAIEEGAASVRDRDLHASWDMGHRDSTSLTNPFASLAAA